MAKKRLVFSRLVITFVFDGVGKNTYQAQEDAKNYAYWYLSEIDEEKIDEISKSGQAQFIKINKKQSSLDQNYIDEVRNNG